METRILIVEEQDQGVRLDKYLSTAMDDCSRSRAQQLIDEEAVRIDDLPVKNSYKVKAGDEIEVTLPEEEALEAQPQEMALNVVYEDHDVIVINKPKGLVVHPGPGNPDHTLVNGLLWHCHDLSGINGVLRPGIVHRIDKDTSGLIVACKNENAHQSLAKQLAEKTAGRQYYALVHGVINHEYGTIDAPIGRDEKDRQKMAVTEKNSRPAITHFKVVERFDNYTLVSCRLETGRTHQIRVHMQYIGFPIVGDPKYSLRKTLPTQGQMLHAYQLSFTHPSTGERMTFEAPLPPEFEALLTQLLQERSGL